MNQEELEQLSKQELINLILLQRKQIAELQEAFKKLNADYEAVFQMMMLAYNLFLLFKFDSLHISEYRQQIKTFRLKYIFLAAKIVRTARYVVMKLVAKYPYQNVFNKCLA
jgi:galactose-1-phosphate uridylyltransferase